MEPLEGIEPPACGLRNRRSLAAHARSRTQPLSYSGISAVEKMVSIVKAFCGARREDFVIQSPPGPDRLFMCLTAFI